MLVQRSSVVSFTTVAYLYRSISLMLSYRYFLCPHGNLNMTSTIILVCVFDVNSPSISWCGRLISISLSLFLLPLSLHPFIRLSLSPKVSAAISSSGELRFLSEQDTEPELTTTK